MSRHYYDDNDEDSDSFKKEYLNIFKKDFLDDDDDADDDYNVVEDILTHKYNIDEKPYYLSIPKKEVNDLINDANLQDEMSLFSDKESDFHFLNRKTNRNKDFRSPNFGNIECLNEHQNSFLFDNNSNHLNNSFNNRNIFQSPEYSVGNVPHKTNNIKNNNKQKNNNINKNKKNVKNKKILRNKNIIQNNINNSINNKKNEIESNIINNNNDNNGLNMDMNYQYLNGMKEINKTKGLSQMDIVEKLAFALKQYDFMLQLLIQNLMMVENTNLKFRCYTLLFSFYLAKQRVVQNMKFPEFHVKFDFNDIFNSTKNNAKKINDQVMRLQLSFFQPPILDIMPILSTFITKKTFTREETTKILKEFFPFINPLYLPIAKKFRHSIYISNNVHSNIGSNTNNIKNIITHEDNKSKENFKLILYNRENNIVEKSKENNNSEINDLRNNNVSNNEVSSNLFNNNNDLSSNNSHYFNVGKNKNDNENNNNLNKNKDENFQNNNNNEVNQNIGKKKMRKKFTYVDDSLLLLGLHFHGKKNYDIIKQLWLPHRSNEEIRHRIKNLVCQNAPLNIIKKYKTMNERPMNSKEFLKFLKGIEWFGLNNKWKLISRYFLPEKTSEYLQSFYILLTERNILPADLTNSNRQNCKNNRGGDIIKKIDIFMDDQIIKNYKENFVEEINKLKSEITNLDSKNVFNGTDVEFEKIDKDSLKNEEETRIKTRNKSKKIQNKNNENNKDIEEKLEDKKGNDFDKTKKNGVEMKNHNIIIENSLNIKEEDLEFKNNFLTNDLFEKIEI